MDAFDQSHAVLIGIDQYEHVRPLRTPVSDATALAEILEEQHGFCSRVVSDEAATLSGLRQILSDLKERVGPNDRVLFYFAGHGIALRSDGKPKGYLLPQDASPMDEAKFLGMVELQEALEELPCRHMLVVLDCCFAGALRWASYRDLAIAPGPLHERRYRWYVEGDAWQAIASAAHNEKALDVVAGNATGERAEAGGDHSPFAQALIEGLHGAADLTSDGVITATELHVFLDDRLRPKEGSSDRMQTPLSWPLKKHGRGQFVFLVPGRELDLRPAPTLNSESNPWRGLEPYESNHRDLFFGRDQAVQALADLVLQKDESGSASAENSRSFVVVTGPSGIGKSSIIRAGLLPKLPESTRTVVMRPEKDPFDSLSRALVREGFEASACDAEAEAPAGPQRWRTIGELERREEAHGGPDLEGMHRARQRMLGLMRAFAKGGRLLLVVDQAEELFTMSARFKADAFIEVLAAALNEADDRLQVIVTVRSDFEPHFLDSALGSRWQDARYVVPQMTQDELRRVIERPASAKVMRFESDKLVDQFINEAVHMPGALPLLSFALSEMYRKYLERDDDDRTLTWVDYDKLQGGVIGSVRVRADQMVDSFDPETRLTARRVLERLVSVESSEFARRRVPRHELDMADPSENERVEEVLSELIAARLIVTDEMGGEPVLELAHDALIISWPRLLFWVKEDLGNIVVLRRLTASARLWAEPGGTGWGTLWVDPARQQQVAVLMGATTPGLNSQEQAFGDASKRRAQRNAVIRWGAIGLLAALAVGISAFAVLWRDQRNEAIARLVASEGFRISADSPIDALPLFVSSLAVRHTPNAVSGLVSLVQDDPHMAMRILSLPDRYTAIGLRAADNTALVGLANGDVIIWPITAEATGASGPLEDPRRHAQTLPGRGRAIIGVASSRDSSNVLAIDEAGTVLEWSLTEPSPQAVDRGTLPIEDVKQSYIDGRPEISISDDASTILVSTWTSLYLWRTGVIYEVEGPPGGANAVHLAPDGNSFLYVEGGDAGSKRLFAVADISDPEAPVYGEALEFPDQRDKWAFGLTVGMSFDPTGQWVAGGTLQANVFLSNLNERGAAPRTFRPLDASMGAGNEIEQVLVGREAKYVAGLHSHRWHLWDAATGTQIGKPIQDEVGLAAFDDTGERLIIGASPNQLRVLDLTADQLIHLACMKAQGGLDPRVWLELAGDYPQPCICSDATQCSR